MSLGYELFKSWNDRDGSINSMKEIYNWIDENNKEAKVEIKTVDFPNENGIWFYDEDCGFIRNRNNSFFQIVGFQVYNGDMMIEEQPLIKQTEVGYLGIICKLINGVLHFLMQVKIEPGNINCVQLSPTIQATRSNFTRKHGGNSPAYLDYFINSRKYKILVDQIQSEQSSRFYKKRNRNIVILVEEEIEVLPSHKWMTLGQIKELMKIDNLVNMDTRTVLSGLPLCVGDITPNEKEIIHSFITEEALYKSFFENITYLNTVPVYNVTNDLKMFSNNVNRIVPLKNLKSWEYKKNEIVCKNNDYSFKVIYCDVAIEGREVKRWEQPMVESTGMAIFGLFSTVIHGVRKYLITIKNEIGCFDIAEMGPTIQIESTKNISDYNRIEKLFVEKWEKKSGIIKSIILSEEGGRFYHEQNYNVIIDISENDLGEIPEGYFWESYSTLNYLSQINNVLNIQLRNLLALIDIK